MRAIAIVVLATLLVPIHVAGQNAPVPAPVPPVGAGARANYSMTYGSPEGVIAEWWQAHSWSAMEIYEDGFGTLRPSYVVSVEEECHPRYPCAPLRLRVDPQTGIVFERRLLRGLFLSFGSSWIGPLETERYWDFAADARLFTHGVNPAWLAHGRTLTPGDTIVVAIPPSPAEPGLTGDATLAVQGWEEVEGRRLLRVDAQVTSSLPDLRRSTLWFDGVHPLPVEAWSDLSYTSCSDECHHYERWLRTRLTSYEPGGEPLAAAAPAFRGERPDVSRVALGREGPGDLDLASFPREDAIARIHADPAAADWFAEHPAAYLVFGQAHELSDFDQTTRWTLRWADGAESLLAELKRPAALGVAAPVDELRVEIEVMPAAYPMFDELPRYEIACIGQAREDAHARLGRIDHPRPDIGVTFSVTWRYGLVDAYCSYREDEPVAMPAVEEHRGGAVLAVTQRARSISAGVLGWNGAVTGVLEADYGSVDPVWLHRDGLASVAPAQG